MNNHSENGLIENSIGAAPVPRPAPPAPVAWDPALAEAAVRAELVAQRQADALGKGLGELMEQSGLRSGRYVPLFGSYDGAKREISFLDMNSPGYEVKTVKVFSDELSGALDYVEGLPAQMKGAYTVDGDGKFHPVEVEIEGSFSGAEGLFAGLALQEIIKKLTETDEDASAALKAHSYVGFTRTGVAGLQDIVKVGEMVGALTEGERLLSVAGNLSKALEVGGLLLDGANTGFDIYEIANAKTLEEKVEYGTRLGNDLTTVAMGGAAFAADLAGAATAAGVISALAVPLAGLGIGIGALVEQAMKNSKEMKAINNYFDKAKAGYEKGGYDWSDDKKNVLMPQVGVVISKLDFTDGAGYVTFGGNTMDQVTLNSGGFKHLSGRVFDLHEGFGVTHSVWLRDNSDAVVLPYMPTTKGDFTYTADSTGRAKSIEEIDKNKLTDNGDVIEFKTRNGLETYQKLSRRFFDTTVEVVMGKDQKQLIMPSGEHEHGDYPSHDGGDHSTNDWTMNYQITGGGGSYSLSLSTYGGVTLNEKADSKSSWILMPGEKMGDEVVVGGRSLTVGGESISIKCPDRTTVRVMLQDGVVQTADFAQQKMVGAALSSEWFTKNPGATFSQMVAAANKYGVTDFDVSGMPIGGRDVPGDNIHGLSNPPRASNTLSGHYDSATGEVSGIDSFGVMLKVKADSVLAEDLVAILPGQLVPTLLGFGSEYFKRNPKATLKTLADEAANYDAKDFDVCDMPIDGSLTMSGHYDAQEQKLTGVDEHGLIWEVACPLGLSGSAYANFSIMRGFAGPYFKEHPNLTLSALVAAAKQIGLGDFQAWDLPVKGGRTVSACYDAKSGVLNGIDSHGALVKIAEDFSPTLQGFGVDYFKRNPAATVMNLVAEAANYDARDFGVSGMPLKGGHTLSGHYNGQSQELSGTDELGRIWEVTNGSTKIIGFTGIYFKAHPLSQLSEMLKPADDLDGGDLEVLNLPIGDNLTISGRYSLHSGIGELIGTDPSGAIFKIAENLTPTLLGVGADYFKTNPHATLDNLAALAKAWGVSSFDVFGMPGKDGHAISGHYSANAETLLGVDQDGLIWEVKPNQNPAMRGFGAPYFKTSGVAFDTMLAKAKEYGAEAFDVDGMPMADGQLLSGRYSAQSGLITGETKDGAIYVLDGRRQPMLVGANLAALPQGAAMLPTLMKLAAGKASVLTLLGVTDTNGKPVSAWYDPAVQKLVVGKSPTDAALSYLGVHKGKAWLFDADHGQLLSTAPIDKTDSLDALKQVPVAEAQYANLPKLVSATRSGATIVVQTSDDVTLSLNPADPADINVLEVTRNATDHGAGLKALLDSKYGYAHNDETIHVRSDKGEHATYSWYNRKSDSFTSERDAAVQYVGYDSTSKRSYLFDPTKGMLFADDSSANPVGIVAKHVVREGNVLGLDGGVSANQLDKLQLPKLDGVDTYVVGTDEGLSFRIKDGKTELLQAGSTWMAQYAKAWHNDVMENAADKMIDFRRTIGPHENLKVSEIRNWMSSLTLDPKDAEIAEVVYHAFGDASGLNMRIPVGVSEEAYETGLNDLLSGGSGDSVELDVVFRNAAQSLKDHCAHSEVDAAVHHINSDLLSNLAAAAKKFETSDFDVDGVPLKGGYILSGRYDGKTGSVTGTDQRGISWTLSAGAEEHTHENQYVVDQAMKGFGSMYFKQHPQVTLADMVTEAKGLGAGEFDVVGMPIAGGHTVSGRYNAQTGKLLGTDEQGKVWDVKGVLTQSTPSVLAAVGLSDVAAPQTSRGQLAQAMSAFVQDGVAGKAAAASPASAAGFLAQPLQSIRPSSSLS
ncbi:TcdA/TcdB pore-forming domain-containing protein [Duganella violaceipulchra]|uniref:TcdA/TcdB toxin pore forming domain-containing protein n=1 Tax=Duganella violaceipulchra TaxID=2849652 RepID=A0AA41HEZ8_9BURK|nr:TcdA/TcdB pore-forming domain-containing protein [Duganella violaceicalia]MBV6322478.1 hypothetical protein [Duganella violaceicalia]MCP2010683.1 hypothetical protein [Duganella violaceicalia]